MVIMVDFFVPKRNEKQLVEAALAMGITDFVFLYSLEDYKKYSKDDSSYQKGVLLKDKVTLSRVLKATKLSEYVVVKATEGIRKIMERCKGIYIYGSEMDDKADFVHFRNSGLNHVLMNIAKEKNITFLFNFRDFLELGNKKRAVVL